MDRVATFANSQAMLAEFTRTQRTLLEAQREVATEKRIHAFSDAPSELSGLMAARGADSRTSDFEASAKAVRTRVNLQDTHISELADAVSDLRPLIVDSLANDNGATIGDQIKTVFSRITSVLNAQVDGKYIYGGTRQDVPPVTATSLEQLVALPDAADAFQNNGTAQSAKIDEHQTVVFGQLADRLGGEAFDLLRQIASFNAGAEGPFAEKLTTAQKDFLSGMVSKVADAASSVNQKLAENGAVYSVADDAVEAHGDARATLKAMIQDIEGVDMAEAISKLNNAQIALQASAKTFATVQGMSLLDFI